VSESLIGGADESNRKAFLISGWALVDEEGNEMDLYGNIIRKAIHEA
jgi:hypothetical protein